MSLFGRRRAASTGWQAEGVDFASRWQAQSIAAEPLPPNDLEAFFNARTEGPGIWKWRHYFEIYDRHLRHLRNRTGVRLLEIGIYSGGSLDLWRHYFGETLQLTGVDIETSCRAYARPGVSVLIGDQGDRQFWRRTFTDGSLAPPDIVIDDGGHTPEQQRVTLEELLPQMPPGSVYLCEDIHGIGNRFTAFVCGLIDALNSHTGTIGNDHDPERRLVAPSTGFQSAIHSVHCYPYLVVIEKRAAMLPELVAPKHGSQWQPFLG